MEHTAVRNLARAHRCRSWLLAPPALSEPRVRVARWDGSGGRSTPDGHLEPVLSGVDLTSALLASPEPFRVAGSLLRISPRPAPAKLDWTLRSLAPSAYDAWLESQPGECCDGRPLCRHRFDALIDDTARHMADILGEGW